MRSRVRVIAACAVALRWKSSTAQLAPHSALATATTRCSGAYATRSGRADVVVVASMPSERPSEPLPLSLLRSL